MQQIVPSRGGAKAREYIWQRGTGTYSHQDDDKLVKLVNRS